MSSGLSRRASSDARVRAFAVDCRALPSPPASVTIRYQARAGYGSMNERTTDRQSTPSQQPAAAPDERLDSWKEIAAYLSRDVTTVQRWEKREGMPVHRHLHGRMGSVYAYRADLDAWARSRNIDRAAGNGNTVLSDPVVKPLRSDSSTTVNSRRFGLALAAITVAVLAIGTALWLWRAKYFWRNPIADAGFQTVTEFDGIEQAAVVSRDGQFVAFLSDRDGQMDVWLTQVGSGQFHNLTHGRVPELTNPSIRTLGFSPDGSLVTFWVRRQDDISIWAAPTLGGELRPYLEGVAEFSWSRDASRLAYHTPRPGDPLFVSDKGDRTTGRLLYTAPAGLHCHFPVWAPDGSYIYFVQGSLPDKMDIWRIRPSGGAPQRITSHNTQVTHPVLLDGRTLLYLATDADGSGPWLYGMDVNRRIPHRLSSGLDRYTSLAASADGSRFAVTRATPKRTLWRLRLSDSQSSTSAAARISLLTSTGFSARLGPDYLLYVSATNTNEAIWKVANGTSSELWSDADARIIGAPAISRDGRQIAFSVRQHGHAHLYVMDADGTHALVVAASLDFQGTPTWAPDGQSITSAANDDGIPHLFRVPLHGGSPVLLANEYSTDPAWAPDGAFLVYSGPDIGTTFPVKALTPEGTPHPLRPLILTRGARHLAVLHGGQAMVLLRGDIQHKNLCFIDLKTGSERQLTHFPPEFDVRDFDISPDGHDAVLERVQERSDIVLLDVSRR